MKIGAESMRSKDLIFGILLCFSSCVLLLLAFQHFLIKMSKMIAIKIMIYEQFMQPNLNSFKHRRNSGERKVGSPYSVTVE